jgi:fructose-specific phosphotransferase system IIA component
MIINKFLINLNLGSQTKEACIMELARLAAKANKVSNINDFVEAALKREEEYTTGIGFGVAIPHGKSEGVTEPFLAFAKTNEPVDWKSMDDHPVHMIFLIGVPKEDTGKEHLKILANLSRKLMKKEFRESLELAQNEDDIMNLMEGIESV